MSRLSPGERLPVWPLWTAVLAIFGMAPPHPGSFPHDFLQLIEDGTDGLRFVNIYTLAVYCTTSLIRTRRSPPAPKTPQPYAAKHHLDPSWLQWYPQPADAAPMDRIRSSFYNPMSTLYFFGLETAVYTAFKAWAAILSLIDITLHYNCNIQGSLSTALHFAFQHAQGHKGRRPSIRYPSIKPFTAN